MPSRKQRSVALPPPRSLYRKIQRVLADARKGKARSREQLISQIDKAGHLDFTRFDTSAEKKRVVPCSVQSIERVIQVCEALRLITESGSLTSRGATAADPERFDDAMRPAIEARLAEIGAPLARIRRVVADALVSASSGNLPTWNGILAHLGGTVARPREFKDLLSLLAACGGIATSRKKIYLPS